MNGFLAKRNYLKPAHDAGPLRGIRKKKLPKAAIGMGDQKQSGKNESRIKKENN
jgi:hypothetical protein